MIEAAVKKHQRQNDKLYETLGRIILYYKQADTVVKYKRSTQAQSYISRKYEQPKLNEFYNKTPCTGAMEREEKFSYNFLLPKIVQRKFKNSRITTYFKQKPDWTRWLIR